MFEFNVAVVIAVIIGLVEAALALYDSFALVYVHLFAAAAAEVVVLRTCCTRTKYNNNNLVKTFFFLHIQPTHY